ncbi:HNH endonuclease [Sphingobacterium faecium]
MKYTVITENDISQWKDNTGKQYHFPKRYLNHITKGTQVVYYKGENKDKSFTPKRLSDLPHYFGIGEIGNVYNDPESTKNDYYAEIINFQPFSYPVIFKQDGSYIEVIPESKKKNYWRDGVRVIDKETFDKIISLSDLDSYNTTNDSEQGEAEAFTSIEGKSKQILSTKYERNPKLRARAIEVHGLTCMACSFNFKDTYGDWGAGFIHVHHTKPLSNGQGEREVDPVKDMIVLCPNCHSMVHRRKNETLSLEELKSLVKNNTITK